MKVGIIGAGIGGLAAAVRLAAAGHDVEVWEASPQPGGKLSEFAVGAYRFDLGPSLFTMPQYVDELFTLCGEEPDLYFSYEKLPVVCEYFWEDGTALSAYAESEKFAGEVEKVLGVERPVLRNALTESRRKYELTGSTFLEHDLRDWRTWLSMSVAEALMQLPRLSVHQSMHAENQKLLKHPKLVQLFDRFATYNGSSPYRAPGILNMIPHFEHGIGAFFPHGGMSAISNSIFELAKRQGVIYNFNTKVEAIKCANDRVNGLYVGGKLHAYDAVVSNADVFFTYKNLLPKKYAPKRILKQEKSSSAVIFYWGISHNFDQLDLHNIFFSDDYAHEFECLAKGEISDDPTIYLNITSKLARGDAPQGHENWFVMINAPYDRGQDWDKLGEKLRENTLSKLSRLLGTDIGQYIQEEYVMNPPIVESRTGSHLGALYGSSSNSQLAAFLRHPNSSTRIKGMYFCGGTVHPGGGVPLSLLSAKLAVSDFTKSNGNG